MQAYFVVDAGDEKRLQTALAAGPDILIIDIEAPGEDASAGRRSRESAAAFLRQGARGGSGTRLYVRIGAFGTGRTEADLEAVMPGTPDGIVLPGAVGRQAVERLGARLAVLEALHGINDGRTKIIASVDDAAGALAIGSLAAAGPRLAGLTWDEDRLRRDLGVDARDGSVPEPCRYLRAATVLTARAGRIPAIDSSHPELSDFGRFAAEVDRARRDGFAAKLVVTEAQAAIVRSRPG